MRAYKIAIIGVRGIPATYGGVERHVEEIATRLVNKGHQVTVFCRSSYTPRMKEYKGVRIVRLPTINVKQVEMIIHTLISALYLIFKRFDLVHIHSVDPTILSPLIKCFHPVVATSHGQAYRREKWGRFAKAMSRIAERIFIRFPDVRTAVSKTLVRHYDATYGRNVEYVPNGVVRREPESSTYIEKFGLQKEEYILWVGRLEPTKGAHLIIEAFRKINPDLKLVIVGGSSHTPAYARSLRAQASEKVVFLGYQYGRILDSLYDHCRLFVFPSQIEGLPIVLIEALSALRPVIFSDTPENLEVAEGIGIKFKSGDVTDLSAKLKCAIDNPHDLEALKPRITEKLNTEYNWDFIVDKYVRIYHDAVKRSLKSVAAKATLSERQDHSHMGEPHPMRDTQKTL